MDYIVKLAFVLIVFIYSWFFQVQNQEWDVVRSMLKDANNIAVHDAAQAINELELSRGRLLIDPEEAYDIYRESLEKNLGLNDDLTPAAGSRLHNGIRILEFTVLDEASGIHFPLLYEDSTYGITQYIQGPSVVAVIETEHPLLISRTKVQEPIRVPAIQENVVRYHP
jgi:hypothetical protein